MSLPVDSTLAEFLRMFPDEGGTSTAQAVDAEADQQPVLSLTLAEGRREQSARARRRLLAASVDSGIVLASSGMAALLIPADFWTCAALFAVGYYSIATTLFGQSFGAQWYGDRRRKRWKQAAASVAVDPDSILTRIRRLREISVRHGGSTARDVGRVSWNAALLRIWTAIRP